MLDVLLKKTNSNYILCGGYSEYRVASPMRGFSNEVYTYNLTEQPQL